MSTITELVREACSGWDDAGTLARVGRELQDRNRLDLAREVLGRAVELDPGDAAAWVYRALAHMRAFMPEKAFELLREGIGRTGSDLLRATLARITFDKEERARLLAGVAGSDDPAVRAAAASAQAPGDPAAFRELRHLAEGHPDDADVGEAWLTAVMMRLRAGAGDVDIRAAALPVAERMIEKRPDRIFGHWMKAHLLLAAEDPDGALAATDDALARFPDDETMMFVRGRAFREKGDLDRAAQCLARAIGMKPSFSGARAELAKVYEAQGKLDLAEEVVREIPRANPGFPGGPALVAFFLGRRGRWDEAESLFLDLWRRLKPWAQARLRQHPDAGPLLARPRVKSVVG